MARPFPAAQQQSVCRLIEGSSYQQTRERVAAGMPQVAAQRMHQPMHGKRKRNIDRQDEQKPAARHHGVVVADQARREYRASDYGDREVDHHVPGAVKEPDIAAEHRERATAQQPHARITQNSATITPKPLAMGDTTTATG